jgi:Protein of unknown function (DUF3429)
MRRSADHTQAANAFDAPSVWAARLGYGGLVPFVGLAIVLWVAGPDIRPFAGLALLGYGATIASFLGAIHWGLAMRERPERAMLPLLWGVTPGLVGCGALLVGNATGLVLIAAVLWVCFAVDRTLYPRYRLQAWLPLRFRLTLVASVGCLAAAVAVRPHGV